MVLLMVVLFMTLANLTKFICYNVMFFTMVGICKMHFKEINIKNSVYNYYFKNIIEAKSQKLEII